MRTIVLLRVLLLGGLSLGANGLIGQQLQWFNHYGSDPLNRFSHGLRLAMDGSGDVYGAGSAGGGGWEIDGFPISVQGRSDILFMKLDGTGQALWVRLIGGSCSQTDVDRASLLTYDPGLDRLLVSGFYQGGGDSLAGIPMPGNCTGSNTFLAAYDTNGDALWGRVVTSHGVRPTAMIALPGGYVKLFGIIGGPLGISPAIFQTDPVVMVDSGAFRATYGGDGELLVAERILRTGGVNAVVREGSDLILGGAFRDSDTLWGAPMEPVAPEGSGFIARYTASEEVLWMNTVGASDFVSIALIGVLTNGNITAFGYYAGDCFVGNDTLASSGTDEESGFIACYSPTGAYLWSKRIVAAEDNTGPFGGAPLFAMNDLKIGPDGHIYLNGWFTGELTIGDLSINASTSREVFIAKIDTLGELKAAVRMGRADLGAIGSLLVNDNGIFVSNTFDSTMVVDHVIATPAYENTPELFIAKFDSISGFTGVQTLKAQESGQLVIYANPNNGLCTIQVPTSVPYGTKLGLTIHDASGQVVHFSEHYSGNGGVEVDIRARAKGLYHVELLADRIRYHGTIVFE